jgi:hypothetical protein
MRILPLTTRQREAFSALTTMVDSTYEKLKVLSINKPYMDKRTAVDAQLDLYVRLYDHAKAGRLDEDKAKSIIEKHEYVNGKIAIAEDMLNDCRGWIEQRIYDNNVDEAFDMLDKAADIKLTLDRITPERMDIIRDIFRYEN